MDGTLKDLRLPGLWPASARPGMTILVNAKAGLGRGADPAARIEALLAAKGVRATVHKAHRASDLVALARQAVALGSDLLVAAGGDGTVNAIASVVVETDSVLGVIPMGTFNNFARDLGLPLDTESALDTLLGGRVVRVDVGEVNGRIFLNNSNLGLYPEIVAQRLWRQRLGMRKWPAFLLATLRILRRYPLLDVRLGTSASEGGGPTPLVFVGNNAYGMDGPGLGRRQRLDGGRLSLYTFHATRRFELLQLLLGMLFRRIRNRQVLDLALVEEVWIHTRRRKLRVATDGEVTELSGPLHYRVRAGALRVVAPRREPA